MANDIVELLEQGYAWTAERVAQVGPEDLDTPTPCEGWQLRHLLNHMLASLERLAGAAEGEVAEPSQFDAQSQALTDRLGDDCGHATFAAVRQRAMTVWHQPDVMARTCELPLGSLPASMAAQINLVEVVVHGWDVSRATGEAAAIPPGLAGPILEFCRQAVDPARGRAFGPDLEVGDTVPERLVAFLGRKP
jgi:uncharacterized protein (TIGR03086 family)